MRNPEVGDIIIVTSKGWDEWNLGAPYLARVENIRPLTQMVRICPVDSDSRSQVRRFREIICNCTIVIDELIAL